LCRANSRELQLDYNSAVARVGLFKGKAQKHAGGAPAPHAHASRKWLENIGLIVILVLILAITLTRYWHNIHWSMR